MVIVYCADRNLYDKLPTAINSVLQNTPKVSKIYLLIEDDSIDYICHPKIEFINLNTFDFLIRDGINCSKKFPYTAMVRCFLTKILKEDKVIYLDVDTVVNSDLSELWSWPLCGAYIAAKCEHDRESNRILPDGYFNSGVMLMDLKSIRLLELEDRVIRLLKNCRFVFPDQDALNFVFKNRIARLPHKFNALGGDEVYDDEIVIRHFAGVVKPWQPYAKPLDTLFWSKYKVDSIVE